MDAILVLVSRLRAVLPARRPVLVLADRGLWSPRLRHQIQHLGWHPLLRLQSSALVQPLGAAGFRPARSLVSEVGTAWVGQATIFKQRQTQLRATLVVVWDVDQQDVWVLLTDLRPRQVGVVWYSLRMWIELGFRVLKGLGWQWQRTRRTDPDRVARHWLVLAVATLWVLATGTRVEDAATVGCVPARLHRPPPVAAADPTTRRPPPRPSRRYALFSRGLSALRRQLGHRRLWTRLWLRPDPWPEPRPHLHISYHDHAPADTHTIPAPEKLSA
jgi:Transposase DDE domain